MNFSNIPLSAILTIAVELRKRIGIGEEELGGQVKMQTRGLQVESC